MGNYDNDMVAVIKRTDEHCNDGPFSSDSISHLQSLITH